MAKLINLALLMLLSLSLCSQERQPTFTVMEYNCENLFDTIHDEGKNDYEFCPDGEKRWTKSKLWKKLRDISKVIAAGDERHPVDIVGLCEVENDSVLTMLTQRSPLSKLGYKYIMTNSDDERGIDVALLYSPFRFHPFLTESIKAPSPKYRTRDILHVAGTIHTSDTVDVYVVHFPSKRGGGEAHTRGIELSRLLRENIDSVASIRQNPNIIALGDFNTDYPSKQLKILTKDSVLTDAVKTLRPGTYKYQGRWSTLDHILYHTTRLSPQSSTILTLPYLVEKDPTNGGIKPRRTYLGPIYKGGPSDHLPIICVFKIIN